VTDLGHHTQRREEFYDGWLIGFLTGFSAFGVLWALMIVTGVLS
jgi:hypothetical protein